MSPGGDRKEGNHWIYVISLVGSKYYERNDYLELDGQGILQGKQPERKRMNHVKTGKVHSKPKKALCTTIPTTF